MRKMWKKLLSIASAGMLFCGLLAGCTDFDREESKNVPEKYVSVWEESTVFSASDLPYVVKPEGRELKVLQLTDVHYDQNNDKKEATLQMIAELIERNAPDVIALTGDWTSATENTQEMACAVFDTVEKAGVPWAPVFGNHDREGELDSYQYADIFATYPNCLFRAGFSNIKGVGNYVVAVKEGSADGNIVSALIMTDSHTSVKRGVEKYMPLGKNQVAWYRWVIKGLNARYAEQGMTGAMPTLCFLHIPLPEYVKAYKKTDYTPDRLLGSNQEKVCCPDKNAGLFEAMTELKSTKGVFCGHDHGNTSACLYKGVVLAYGVESGWCKDYRTEQQKGALVATLTNAGELFITHDYYPLAKK